jgi:hypothetical protein
MRPALRFGVIHERNFRFLRSVLKKLLSGMGAVGISFRKSMATILILENRQEISAVQ